MRCASSFQIKVAFFSLIEVIYKYAGKRKINDQRGLDGRGNFKLSADLEDGRVPDTCPLLENSNLLKEKNSNFTSKIFFDLTIVENKSDIHVNI